VAIKDPKAGDYAGLLMVSFVWGSSFAAIATALQSFGPFTIAGGRITVAALFISLLALARGHTFPRDAAVWGRLMFIGLTGSALPFTLIAWAQQTVDSSLAAIVMALTPLNTLIVAHLATHDERLSRRKVVGLVIGFLGVALLVAGSGNGSTASALAIGAVYMGTLSYAISAVQMRKLDHLPPVVMAAGLMICSLVVALPLAFMVEDPDLTAASPMSLAAVFYLGLFSSGLAIVLMAWVIIRVGAVFLSLSNYLVPMVGVVLGIFLLDEVLGVSTLLAFALIMTGVTVTTRPKRRPPEDLEKPEQPQL
jgi:drug/metabolite transporter (DMT)-like permease